MKYSSQKIVQDFPDKIITKLKQADELIIKEYDFFTSGKNTFINNQNELINNINKFYNDLKEAFEIDHNNNINYINNYFSKVKKEFDKVDELLQNKKRIIDKGLNYISLLKNQNFIEIQLVDQLELIEQLNLNSLLDNNINNKINLFLFQIKNNMLLPELIINNKVYSLVQEIRSSFNIKINEKIFNEINIENININNVLSNKNKIDISNSSSLFMNHNEIYLQEENTELKNIIEDLCGYVNNLEINLSPKFIWFEPNSNNIYDIILDKNNIMKTEKIEYNYITNGSDINNNNKKNNIFNDEFRVSNINNELIYISGGELNLNENGTNNNKKIIKTLYEYSLNEKILKEKSHMKLGRIYHGNILINTSLFICGGLAQNLNITNSCEKYIIKENKWLDISPMKEELSKINLVQIDEKSFAIFGGEKKDNSFNYNIHYYRIDIDTWFVLDNFKIPKGLLFPGLCKIDNKYIIIFGGIEENGEENNHVFRMDISVGNYQQINKCLNIGGKVLYFPKYNNNEIHMLINHQNQKYPDRIVFNL